MLLQRYENVFVCAGKQPLTVLKQIFRSHRNQLNSTGHGILHYLWSVDLSKRFYQLIVPMLIFSQYFFQ